LLAAGERASLLPPPLGEPREIAIDALEIGADLRAVAADIGAEAEILLDAELHESAAAVRYMGNAEARDLLGREARDVASAEPEGALPLHHRRDRPQQRRLAGAIGTQQRGDAARLHREVDTVQHLRRTVGGVEAAHLQQRRHHAASPR